MKYRVTDHSGDRKWPGAVSPLLCCDPPSYSGDAVSSEMFGPPGLGQLLNANLYRFLGLGVCNVYYRHQIWAVRSNLIFRVPDIPLQPFFNVF